MLIQTDLSSFGYKKGSLCPVCKRCGGQNFYRSGKNKKGLQRYRCRACDFRFIWSSDLPRRNFLSQVMSFAVEMYITTGISLRTIARKMYKFFKIKVSHEDIRQWILASKKVISRREIDVPTTWHVDETYIKVKGRGFWL
jgi:transposase-like protein